jgi:hypothetical protein
VEVARGADEHARCGFFFVEHRNVPMHLGSLVVFEGPAPAYRDLVELFAAKLPRVPRLPPGRAGPCRCNVFRPAWTDDENFEIGYHMRHAAVPKPGKARQLRHLAGRSSRSGSTAKGRCGKRGFWRASRPAAERCSRRSTTAWWMASAAPIS